MSAGRLGWWIRFIKYHEERLVSCIYVCCGQFNVSGSCSRSSIYSLNYQILPKSVLPDILCITGRLVSPRRWIYTAETSMRFHWKASSCEVGTVVRDTDNVRSIYFLLINVWLDESFRTQTWCRKDGDGDSSQQCQFGLQSGSGHEEGNQWSILWTLLVSGWYNTHCHNWNSPCRDLRKGQTTTGSV